MKEGKLSTVSQCTLVYCPPLNFVMASIVHTYLCASIFLPILPSTRWWHASGVRDLHRASDDTGSEEGWWNMAQGDLVLSQSSTVSCWVWSLNCYLYSTQLQITCAVSTVCSDVHCYVSFLYIASVNSILVYMSLRAPATCTSSLHVCHLRGCVWVCACTCVYLLCTYSALYIAPHLDIKIISHLQYNLPLNN